MLQETLLRLEGFENLEPAIVVINEEHRFIVAEQLQQINRKADIILEPEGRNTAPAVALAALKAKETAEDAVMLVLAADHNIKDLEAFHQALKIAADCAADEKLVTFGITPERPETGYGYIKAGDKSAEQLFAVERFVEKPNLSKAEEYLADGGYYWNSGMFMMRTDTYLNELNTFFPEMITQCTLAMAKGLHDLDFIRPNKEAFEACPSQSIDYAVMEKSSKVMLVSLSAGWSDVGAWSELWEISDKDENGNVLSGDVFTSSSKNLLVKARKKFVSVLGVSDLVVIEDGDSVLIADRNSSQNVKEVVEYLKSQDRPEATLHRKAYRPWGTYDCVDQDERFKVKRICVKPGSKLSLQMHHHRAEHWIVVKGTALVTNGDKQQLLTENESTYIPIGVVHCLENPGKVDLEIIEVQSGAYLEEDDIVRYEDIYGRCEEKSTLNEQ